MNTCSAVAWAKNTHMPEAQQNMAQICSTTCILDTQTSQPTSPKIHQDTCRSTFINQCDLGICPQQNTGKVDALLLAQWPWRIAMDPIIISIASSNKSVIDRTFWEEYRIRIIYVQLNKSVRRHCGRCYPWFVTPPSDGGFSATTEAIVRVWLPHPSARCRSISLLKKCIYWHSYVFFYYQGTSLNGRHPEQIETNLHVSHSLVYWHIRHMMFSFNLNCPGAKGLTILSLLPGCVALIQLGFLNLIAVAHIGLWLKAETCASLLIKNYILGGKQPWTSKTPVQPMTENIYS